uniref:SLC13 family permease n=1 Tax=Ningiella ruwaisensis TaxID=2364274 RepID=UPI00109F0919|nr:SLC13 family permease [Ningiella ruwaisensis]
MEKMTKSQNRQDMYKSRVQISGLVISLGVFLLSGMLGASFEASTTMAVLFICALYWVTEAIPIPMTACIPLAVFPLLGVISKADLGSAFGNPINFLLIGGFMLSIAMVKSKAHIRLTRLIFSVLRPSTQKQVVTTFMLSAAFLSMWISNAAAAMMLIPVAIATLESSHKQAIEQSKYEQSDGFTVAVLLGICYAASVGGMGTPIGTPPNLVFIQAYEQATGTSISFLSWMKWALPCVAVLLPIVIFHLCRKCENTSSEIRFEDKTDKVWKRDEKRVLGIFVLVIFLWMTRSDPYGGWSAWLNLPNAHDGYVALLGAILLFLIPNGNRHEPGSALLTWEDAASLPWGVILLVSGGIALSLGLRNTGLITEFAQGFSALSDLPLILIVALICLSVTFITELMSNTACTALMMPVLAALAIALNVDPLLLMLPAALTASCAFMMPMATAPNAIVFGTNKISIASMIKMGAPLNLIGVVVITLLILGMATFIY